MEAAEGSLTLRTRCLDAMAVMDDRVCQCGSHRGNLFGGSAANVRPNCDAAGRIECRGDQPIRNAVGGHTGGPQPIADIRCGRFSQAPPARFQRSDKTADNSVGGAIIDTGC
jgi:hypothetical protein